MIAQLVDAGRGTPLSLKEKVNLGFEIVGTYVQVRRTLRRESFPVVLAQLRRPSPSASEPVRDAVGQRRAGIRLGRVVGRTLGVLPFDSRCLVRSLVLTRLLARRGIETRFVIGVSSKDEFEAHAWVELGGLPLLPTGGPKFDRLTEL